MSLQSAFHAVVTPGLVAGWAALSLACVAVLWWDLRTRNRPLPSLMRLVWSLTVLYSGPLGLAVYWYSGRTQIPRDSLWRRGFRSVSHCYSGCGAGEVLGVVLTLGILRLATGWVVAATFGFAYLFGYGLTVGPLLQDGVPLRGAVTDAFYTETASITVMELVAVGVDLFLAGDATILEPLFWAALAVSLSVGFLAAYPVNLALIELGVKEGMGNPAAMR